MNKILISIQGKTLILQYQVRSAPARNGSGRASYISVSPSPELSRFDLKGLSAEMFCVNIADMVNLRGQFCGVVENERQAPVARWSTSQEDYLAAGRLLAAKLSHSQTVDLLSPLPGYSQEVDGQFIDFEARIVCHASADGNIYSGYRLTVVTEDIGERRAPYAYFSLDVHSGEGWQGVPPPSPHHVAVREALNGRLEAIRAAGVQLSQVYDETDYACL